MTTTIIITIIYYDIRALYIFVWFGFARGSTRHHVRIWQKIAESAGALSCFRHANRCAHRCAAVAKRRARPAKRTDRKMTSRPESSKNAGVAENPINATRGTVKYVFNNKKTSSRRQNTFKTYKLIPRADSVHQNTAACIRRTSFTMKIFSFLVQHSARPHFCGKTPIVSESTVFFLQNISLTLQHIKGRINT